MDENESTKMGNDYVDPQFVFEDLKTRFFSSEEQLQFKNPLAKNLH